MTASVLAMVLNFMAPCPRCHPTGRAEELAADFVQYGTQYNVDPHVLATWAFYESSYRRDRIGKLGEVGIFQVHGQHRKACEAANVDIYGVECGALLIDMDTRHCGDLESGLNRYSSGSCNGTPRSKRTIEFRLGQVRKWSAR